MKDSHKQIPSKLIKKTKKLWDKIKKEEIFLFVLFPSFVVLIFLLLFINLSFESYNKLHETNPLIVNFKVSDYPVLSKNISADISAKAAVVIDNDSKVILFAKNPKLLFSMASTTKIMTALVALDYYNLGDILTVKTEGVGGITTGFKIGQKVLFKDLLYAMLLPSSNDAAFAIAENYKGGQEVFIRKMNEYALRLNLFNTRFADPAGILDEKDHTTAIELARLASHALKNKLFFQIVSKKHEVISDAEGLFKHSIYNLNKLLGIDGINGIKTGFTQEAGQILVTSKKTQDGHTLIAVVMDSQDRFLDTKIIFDNISDNLNYASIHP